MTGFGYTITRPGGCTPVNTMGAGQVNVTVPGTGLGPTGESPQLPAARSDTLATADARTRHR